MDENERKDRESLAGRLNKMLAALRSFGTNNAAAQGGIYQDVGRGWGMGAGQAPTIYGDNAVPMRPPPLEQQQGLPPPMQPQGQPNIAALMDRPHRGTPMHGMHRDEGAMDRMMMAIAQPYMEGPNMNITDDTRDRAMAWLRAQQGG